MLKRKVFLLTALSLFIILTASAGAWADTGNWDQFQNSIYNSGVTFDAAPTRDITTGWRVQVDHGTAGMHTGANHTPLAANGKVYVMGALGQMRALDAKTGAEIWKTDLSCALHQFQLVTPALGEGKVFTATNDGHVYALDAENGNILWDKQGFTNEYAQMYTPVKYSDGKIYVGSWGDQANTYYCFDSNSGDLIWKRDATSGDLGYYWSGACIAGDYLVFGDQNSYLTCLNKNTGALICEVDLKGIEQNVQKVHSSVSYNPQAKRVYFTDEGGHCWAFDLKPGTGDLKYRWHKKLGKIANSTPAVYNGRLYVGTGTYAAKGDLFCLAEATGAEIWKFDLAGQSEFSVPGVQASPSLSVQNGKAYIYFVTNWERSQAFCLDENGNKIWEFSGEETGTFPAHTTSSVALADGWLYFGNDGGWVYALTSQEALAKSKETLTGSFKDVTSRHWARDDIEYMVSRGHVHGYEDGTFRPGNPVTRAEFSALLVSALGLESTQEDSFFKDVKPDKWYYTAVNTACRNGLVKGYSADTFAPEASISREQVVAIIFRALELQGKNVKIEDVSMPGELCLFTDSDRVSAWAKTSVAVISEKGMLNDCFHRELQPGQKANRAWCAAMLRKIVN